MDTEDLLRQTPSALYQEGQRLWQAVARYREHVRYFFHQVVLSDHACPRCEGRLEMVQDGLCHCGGCGQVFDPTLAFQRCAACGGRSTRKTVRYFCTGCGRSLRSRYTFGVLVFDRAYFARKMQESRQRQKTRKEVIRRLLAASRSEEYHPEEPVELGTIEGLPQALDELVSGTFPSQRLGVLASRPEFDLERYRRHILNCLEGCERLFDRIPPLLDDKRHDRVFRFIALVFMDHQGDIRLLQYDRKILVETV